MRRRNIYTAAWSAGIVLLGLILASSANAQDIRLQKAVVASGGSTVTNGTMTMSYTVGQPVVGSATNGTTNGTFGFWMGSAQVSGVVDAMEVQGVTLLGINPNPVTDGTGTIELAIARAGDVDISLYNTLGERLATLYQGRTEIGTIDIDFDLANLATGTYYVAVRVPGGLIQQPLAVLK